MVSKIEQIIEEMEELIDNCKYATFSSTKILVDKEEIDELLHELKTHTPDEIMRCQKIISNKEAIIQDASVKADALIKQAQAFSDQMVSEHQILQQAYAEAGSIVNNAKLQAQEMYTNADAQAREIQSSAMQYTDDTLASIQEILVASIQESQANNNNLISSLSQILSVVNANRAELHPEEEELARTAAIAERAEMEKQMMLANNPEAVSAPVPAPEPVLRAEEPVKAPEPAPEQVSATVKEEVKPAPVTEEVKPAGKAIGGGIVRGGFAKSILERKE